ncbi:MAG: tRNA 2-thiouridine(34) synthase MnmA [Candidatus Margulisiibacteriota bacterium]
MSTKVMVAMSGGVDSSVAAALLREQGYEVIGITMNLACSSQSYDRGCCSVSAANDAKRVANKLGIAHYVLNFKEEFKRLVVDNFIEEYKNGRTPNPCIRCNQFIKFDLLLKKAKELGVEFVATGHYARIINSQPQTSSYKLLKGKDKKKEQSYVLYRLNQGTLGHVLFPLGELTKEQVRKIAKDFDLPVAEKEESQEICFVEDDDYRQFLRKFVPEAIKPGPILDRSGNIVGMHGGIAFYTIGQRKGLGHHRGRPKYVVEINRVNNSIIIGDDEEILRKELVAEDVSFISGKLPKGPLEITAKIRYNCPEAEAVLYVGDREQGIGNRVKVVFREPQRAITPGQSVVFYKGEEVVGGGVIC